jgi:hypothetical protein
MSTPVENSVLDSILAKLDQVVAASEQQRIRIEKLEKGNNEKPTTPEAPENLWNQPTDTPFHQPKGPPGARTVKRQSSLFTMTEDDLQESSTSTQVVTMSIPSYVVADNEKIKYVSLSAFLYGMERYTQYLKTTPEAKLSQTRKTMAEFCSKDVLEAIYLSEKSKSTELSISLSHSHDLIGISNGHLLNAAARFLRPKSRFEFFDVLSHTVAKIRLPKLPEMKDSENEYSLRVEGYDKLLFKAMDQLIRTVCDAAKFLYQGAQTDDLTRLPLLKWGKEKEPELFLVLVSLFEPYSKSIIRALGGMGVLQTTVKEVEELRLVLNDFNALQAKRSKTLSDTNAEFAPVKTLNELMSAVSYKEARNKRQESLTPVVKSIQGNEVVPEDSYNYSSPIGQHGHADGSTLDVSTDFEYGDTFSPPEEFEEANLMLAKYQPPEPLKDFCSAYFWRGTCEAGEACIHKAGHTRAAVMAALEKRVDSMVKSTSIGADMLMDMIKKVKDQPIQPPLTPSYHSRPNLPPPRTPLDQTRFKGGSTNVGSRNPYDSNRSSHSHGKPTLRLIADEVDPAGAVSQGGATGLAEMD